MGSTLAEALLASGHRDTVWNRTASQCGTLAEAPGDFEQPNKRHVTQIEDYVTEYTLEAK